MAWQSGLALPLAGRVLIVSRRRIAGRRPSLRGWMAMGADLSRITFSNCQDDDHALGTRRRPSIPIYLYNREYWRESANQSGGFTDCKMLIFDPLPSYLGKSVNDAKNAELRAAIEPFLDEVTRPIGSLLCLQHTLEQVGHGIDAAASSGGLNGVRSFTFRNVHFVVADPEEEAGESGVLPGEVQQRPCRSAGGSVRDDCGDHPEPQQVTSKRHSRSLMPSRCNLTSPRRCRAARKSPGQPRTRRRKWPSGCSTTSRDAGHPVLLAELYDQAGTREFVGEYKPGKDGKSSVVVNGGGSLSRPRTMVTAMGPPFNGWVINECTVDGKKHWEAFSVA